MFQNVFEANLKGVIQNFLLVSLAGASFRSCLPGPPKPLCGLERQQAMNCRTGRRNDQTFAPKCLHEYCCPWKEQIGLKKRLCSCEQKQNPIRNCFAPMYCFFFAFQEADAVVRLHSHCTIF